MLTMKPGSPEKPAAPASRSEVNRICLFLNFCILFFTFSLRVLLPMLVGIFGGNCMNLPYNSATAAPARVDLLFLRPVFLFHVFPKALQACVVCFHIVLVVIDD